jgi:hypothetical protein
MGYQVGQFYSPPLKKERRISFPSGTSVKVKFPSGLGKEGQFHVAKETGSIQNSLILSFPVSDNMPDEFSVSLPVIEIDGEQFDLGEVKFRRVSETWYIFNC